MALEQKNKFRVLVTQGAAQLLFLVAALRHENVDGDDHLVIYVKYGEEDVAEKIRKLAEVAWEWSSIAVVNFGERDSELSTWFAGLPGLALPEEIWCCMPGGHIERRIMAEYPAADLVLYEDGLLTYAEMESIPDLILHPRRLLRTVIRDVNRILGYPAKHGWFATWPFRRVSRAFLLLDETLPVPKYLKHAQVISTSGENLKRAIIEICDALNVESAGRVADDALLFLGAPAYIGHNITWEGELEIYIEIIQQIVDKGYVVYWKEHPKVDRPFFPHLLQQFSESQVRELDVNSKWPIELLLRDTGFRACTGVASTSLFTIPLLYGGTMYGTLNAFRDYLLPLSVKSTQYADSAMEPIENLPAANLASENKSVLTAESQSD